jgi:CRP-like cAMP-binding protein
MIEHTPPPIDKLFRRHPVKRYKRGQVLLLSGEFPSRVFYLLEGSVKQYDVSYRGDEIVVNVFRAGAFFPMLYVLTNLPNPYCLEAETDITVIDAPAEEVLGYLKGHPEVAFDLLATVYHGVDNMLRRITHLLGGSTNGRIIYELLIEVRRWCLPFEHYRERSGRQGRLVARNSQPGNFQDETRRLAAQWSAYCRTGYLPT